MRLPNPRSKRSRPSSVRSKSIVERLFQGLVLSQVLDTFPDGVVIATNKGNILLCNDTAKGIFQRSNTTPRQVRRGCRL